jgi:hypothetical protein
MPDGSVSIATMKDAALAWARAGFSVLPCVQGGKCPVGHLVPNGFKNATTDEATITTWWAENPAYNIGVVPGSGGYVVLDLDVGDVPGQFAGLAEWEAFEGEKPAAVTVLTPSGGRHLWFKGLVNSGRKLAPHIDVRCTYGYVLAPPSIVDGKAYAFEGAQLW